ncbi:MAG TPA: hypothetical protein PKC49_15835 [Phycisphaerae bacterium]|nr:hypothetical protein [Phycisphaerae bacterium]
MAELGSSLGVPAALPYFAMELVHGEPVTQYCVRKQLSIRQRLNLFRDICDAAQR